MATEYKLAAETRSDLGKGASRRLRLKNKVPAVVYGAAKDAVSVTLNSFELARHLQDEVFYASLIELAIDGKEETVFLRDLQRHPAKEVVIHADFQRVRDDVEMTVTIPLHFKNEETSKGVKIDGGFITHSAMDVEISCLPKFLPEYIEVDMQEVGVGDTVFISDINFPEGVTSVTLSYGEEYDQPIATIQEKKAAPEPEEIAVESDAEGEGEGDDAGESDDA